MLRASRPLLSIQVEGGDLLGHVQDIGMGGARLEVRGTGTQTIPPVGDLLSLNFCIADLGQSPSITCRVIHHDEPQPTDAPEDLPRVLQVEFVDLSEAAERFIANCHMLQSLPIRQAEELVMGLLDPAILLDLRWRALSYNASYIKLTGMRPRALKRRLDSGISPFDLMGTGQDRQCGSTVVQTSRPMHMAQTTIQSQLGNFHTGTVSFIPVLGAYGKVIAVIQTFRDESAENRMQEHYKKLLAIERGRVARMTKLVTGLSHQMNTPMGIINTASSLIETALGSHDNELAPHGDDWEEEVERVFGEVRDSNALLRKNVTRVNVLVSKVKELSSTQLSASRARADLGEVIQEAIALLAPETQRHKIEVICRFRSGEDLAWDGYPEHMTRVIHELIQNVIHHAYRKQRGGTVEIRIDRMPVNQAYRVELQDHGEGIEDELLPYVFDPFVTRDQARSSGLGLAIVENIVTNLLHGTIACTSSLGQGTTFAIQVPQTVR